MTRLTDTQIATSILVLRWQNVIKTQPKDRFTPGAHERDISDLQSDGTDGTDLAKETPSIAIGCITCNRLQR